MIKDEVFKDQIEQSSDFKFDSKVVKVFDDMVERSVPLYIEIQRMISELAGQYAKSKSSVYDLGCSTGTTMINMDTNIPDDVKFIGIDNSQEMLNQCRENLLANGIKREFNLKYSNLNEGIRLKEASVVVLCLTLQFIRPIHRARLLEDIYKGLNKGGCLIIIEKILAEDSILNRSFIEFYYSFKKRNAYSEMEISQKREALENVLIPYKLSEDQEMLLAAGFGHTEVFLKWYNFAGIIALK